MLAAESGWWADTVIEHFGRSSHRDSGILSTRLELRADLLGAPVALLSTEEKQTLVAGEPCCQNPPILLLDEPTGPLDADSVIKVETLLAERMAGGTAVLLVTHDPNQAERLGPALSHGGGTSGNAMNPILLTPLDISIAASLIILDAVLSIGSGFGCIGKSPSPRQEWSCNWSPSAMCSVSSLP